MAAVVWAPAAMRRRIPIAITEARVAEKAKATANMPATICMMPRARSQPHFFRTPFASSINMPATGSLAMLAMIDLLMKDEESHAAGAHPAAFALRTDGGGYWAASASSRATAA
jgi:hypothetical protein